MLRVMLRRRDSSVRDHIKTDAKETRFDIKRRCSLTQRLFYVSRVSNAGRTMTLGSAESVIVVSTSGISKGVRVKAAGGQG